jgi:coenzyme F420-reducing hydrogenase delta subunit
MFAVHALQQGADGVLISGCHPGDCHYTQGNFFARRRMKMMTSLLEYLGIDIRRVQMSWISASQGQKFADVVEKVTEDVRALGPNTQFPREV